VTSPRAEPATRPSPVSVAAGVDIGSNSVHLLVAGVRGQRLEALADESAFLGLGAAVDATRHLGSETRAALVAALSAFVERARLFGAESITFVATDPFRRAEDAAEAVAEIRDVTGIPVEILSSEDEALLALLGVNGGRPVIRETLIVDVGGGSSELLLVGPSGDPIAAGLPLGAARLSRQLVRGDPPDAAEIAALLEACRQALELAPDGAPVEIVAVGGTASNLLRIGPPLPEPLLTRKRMESALMLLTEAPAELISSWHGVKASRARVLPAGAAIVLAVTERYGADAVRVSHSGLREGLLLAATHAGPAWHRDLAWLAHGWSR
jgi:exopolyphosphatase/guanosine-5'-triphosphate,3'-diphosphate pyrophosphatase